jgi:ankyrin repeat protein
MVGDVGCGKTTLAESIRHSLEVHVKTRLVSEPATLCVFFCKDDGESGTEIAILRGLLHQMASNDRDLLKHLARRSTGKPIGLCSVDDLEHVVSSYIRSVERKFILVIDGVDECKESSRTRFLKFLRAEIHEIDPGRLKVMLLTRPYRSIMHILPDTEYCKQFQLLEIQRQDMEKIIDYHVAEFMNKGPYEKEVRELLTKELLSRAEGSPQWVKLVLDFLYETGATKAINLGKFLRQVRSADLESVYSRLFEQIPLPSRKYAEQVLCIIAGACRPLSLDELSYATTLDLEDQSEMTLGGLKKRCDPAWILNSLGPLIRTHDLKAESKVYLVHQSLKDLIMRGPPTSWSSLNNLGSTTDTSLTQFDSINNLLASLCIFYLRLSVFEDASLFLQEDLDAILPYYPESETEEEEVTGPPPFFEYASVHWSVHFKASSKLLSTELIQHSMSLSRPNTHRLFNWSEQYRQHMIQTVGWDPLPPLKAIDPLVTAAFFGHHNVVSTILDDISCNLNPDHSGHNACIWASRNGHSGILKTILSHKAYVSLGRAVLNECLYSATEGDHEHTAKTILNLMDLEPDEQITFLRGDGSSPLLVAVKYGFFDIAQLLLAKSDISHGGMELLDSAIPTVRHDESPKMKLSRVKILEMLVRDVRVDIAARNKRGVTILSRAAQVGCSSAIEILLQSGRQDDILSLLDDSGDEEGRSPLWHAAHWNKTEVVRLLCDQDGIENQLRCIDRVNGENVIAAAARYSNRAIVQMLLDKYPNGVKSLDDPSSFLPWIESRDHAGRTPLSTTALNQEDGADIAQILLETGRVDVESRSAGPSGYSALDYAVLENAPLAKNIDLCRVLIVEGGADWRSVVSFSEGGEPTLLKVPIFPGFDNDELLRGLCQIIDEVRTDS